MKDKPYELIDYQEKYLTKIFIINTITICFVLLLLSSFIILKYKTYYQTKAVVSYIDNNYYLQIMAPINKIDSLVNNKYLYIDNKKYKYIVSSISEDLVIDNSYLNYQNIYLLVTLEEEKKINNYVLDIKFLEKDKPIIYYFAQYLR